MRVLGCPHDALENRRCRDKCVRDYDHLCVPTLDGLGVAGDKYHTLEEHIEIDSLSMRGKMMAGLLMNINHDL